MTPKFYKGAGSMTAQALTVAIMALCDFVLTSFTTRGRSTKAVDQIVDRFWSGQANRVNKEREAKALASGQTSYTRVNAYDAIKGVYQGNPEYRCTEVDVVNLIDRICKAGNIETFVSPETAKEVFNSLTERYAAHPDAQKYITLDDLDDDKVAEFDEIDEPKKNTAPASAQTNGKPAAAPAVASV